MCLFLLCLIKLVLRVLSMKTSHNNCYTYLDVTSCPLYLVLCQQETKLNQKCKKVYLISFIILIEKEH